MISSTVSLLNLPTHDFDGWGGFLTCESTKIAWLFSLDDLFGPLLIIFSPAFLVELYPLFLHFPTMLQSFFHHFSKILHSCSIIFHHFSSIFQHFPVQKKAPHLSGGARLGCARRVGSSAFHGSQVGHGGFQGAGGTPWGERVQTWD